MNNKQTYLALILLGISLACLGIAYNYFTVSKQYSPVYQCVVGLETGIHQPQGYIVYNTSKPSCVYNANTSEVCPNNYYNNGQVGYWKNTNN